MLRFSWCHSRTDVESEPEEEIAAVSGHAELHDTTSYVNRDWTKKEIAWRKVSEEGGLPGKFWEYVFVTWLQLSVVLFNPNCIKKTSILKVCGLADRPDKAQVQTFYISALWCSYFNLILICLLQLNHRKISPDYSRCVTWNCRSLETDGVANICRLCLNTNKHKRSGGHTHVRVKICFAFGVNTLLLPRLLLSAAPILKMLWMQPQLLIISVLSLVVVNQTNTYQASSETHTRNRS